MSEAGKMAQEHIEALHEHESSGHKPSLGRRSKATAIAIAAMAAVLAIADLNANNAMKNAITGESRIGALETKLNARDNHRIILENDKVLLDAIMSGQSPSQAAQTRSTEAKEAALAAQIAVEERAISNVIKTVRAEVTSAENEYENLELGIGALQIGIVLASISIVAGALCLWLLTGGLAAGLLGLAMAVYAIYLL